MRTSEVRGPRGWILDAGIVSAGLVCAALLVSPVAAQSNKPAAKSKQSTPNAKPDATAKTTLNTQSVNAVLAIPGYPPDMPAAIRDSLTKQLQQQLDERSTRRRQAAEEAEQWLQLAGATSDDKLKPAMLVLAGSRRVDGQKWDEAVATFKRVVKDFPQSEWAVEARLFLFDLALEHELSVTRATDVLQPAIKWSNNIPRPAVFQKPTVLATAVPVGYPGDPLPLQSSGPKITTTSFAVQDRGASSASADAKSPSAVVEPAKSTREPPSSGTDLASQVPALRASPRIVGDVRSRAALLLAMKSSPRARIEFALAQLYGIDETTAVGTYANRVLSKHVEPLLPDPVQNGSAETAQLIRWAIILEESLERYRAVRLWDALLEQPSDRITDPQRSYVHFRRARMRTFLSNPFDREPERIFADYEAAVTLYPKSEWTEQAMNSHGEALWGLNFDADRSVAIWKRLLDEYPDSPRNDGVALSIGRVYHAGRKWELAKATLEDAQQRFPKSTLTGEYDRLLRSVRNELSRPKPK